MVSFDPLKDLEKELTSLAPYWPADFIKTIFEYEFRNEEDKEFWHRVALKEKIKRL